MYASNISAKGNYGGSGNSGAEKTGVLSGKKIEQIDDSDKSRDSCCTTAWAYLKLFGISFFISLPVAWIVLLANYEAKKNDGCDWVDGSSSYDPSTDLSSSACSEIAAEVFKPAVVTLAIGSAILPVGRLLIGACDNVLTKITNVEKTPLLSNNNNESGKKSALKSRGDNSV
ncbi:hypothetical protein [Paraburkholderia bonniea]|uniref:hypothetical protein n=1 Tax=Paraburkholderia bonniea TaxID=2152891 RepID=UPI001290EC44|nr:hypothetical protein [Paraburkholderia bonniea]